MAQSWPLARHLDTHVTGDPRGDTGVYIWNTWVFGRELLQQRHSPFTTDTVLTIGGPADLSLHNYTVASDLLAIPLQPLLGIVGAFNIIYLINVALTGLGMFLLLRRLPQTAGAGPGIAWIGAFLFACSPFLVARGNGHFSVASAAALPFFAWSLTRTLESRRWTDAVTVGACVAWAAYSDPYHAVYCVMLGMALLAARTIDVRGTPRVGPTPRTLRLIDGLILLVALAILVIGGLQGGSVTMGGVTISMRSLYTPVLVLSMLVAVRVIRTVRPRVTLTPLPVRALLPSGLIAVVAAGLLLAPLAAAMVTRSVEGRMVAAPVPWRSSAPGADLAAIVMPNPNHPLTPAGLVTWVRQQPGESIAALPWVALLTIALAWRRAGLRPDRTWLAIAVVFLWMSLGPFIRIAGIDTFVPTPWTFLRYVPLVGDARMPSRMSVVVVLAVSVIFTAALAALGARRRGLVAVVGIALAFELLAAPRTLYRASVPGLFDIVRQGPAEARVLHIPTGIKDGLDTYGNFDVATLFYQTTHHRPIISGYLSRVAEQRKTRYLRHPVLGPLIAESAGMPATPDQWDTARTHASAFIDEQHLGWVVIDERQASPSLQTRARDVLHLHLVTRQDGLALYTPEPAAATP